MSGKHFRAPFFLSPLDAEVLSPIVDNALGCVVVRTDLQGRIRDVIAVFCLFGDATLYAKAESERDSTHLYIVMPTPFNVKSRHTVTESPI